MNRYREGHGIPYEEHLEWLKEHNWTEAEFDAGFQLGVATKNFLKYEELLRDELGKGKVGGGGGGGQDGWVGPTGNP